MIWLCKWAELILQTIDMSIHKTVMNHICNWQFQNTFCVIHLHIIYPELYLSPKMFLSNNNSGFSQDTVIPATKIIFSVFSFLHVEIFGHNLMFVLCIIVGRDSSVGITTGYGLVGTGIESRWGRDFSHTSRPALGPTQPPIQWVSGLSRG
jgi:hypothetical protein